MPVFPAYSAGMVRPKKKPSERFEAAMRLRMRGSDLELMRRAAERSGLSVSGWSRDRLLRAARRELRKRDPG